MFSFLSFSTEEGFVIVSASADSTVKIWSLPSLSSAAEEDERNLKEQQTIDFAPQMMEAGTYCLQTSRVFSCVSLFLAILPISSS